MADEKKNTGPEEAVVTEAPTPENPGGPPVPPAPEQEAEQGTIPGMEEKADPTETVIDLAAARKAVKEQAAPEAGAPPAGPGGGAPGSDEPGGDGGKTPEPEKKPARRGRRPKAEQEAPGGGEPGADEKAKQGRAAKKEKAPTDKEKAPKKEKAPRAPKDKGGGGGPASGPAAGSPPAPEPTVPREPPRSGETEQIVYIDLGELHAFKDHPFGVRDDDEMRSLVESVKVGGVNQPALVRPREDGGYEIIAGHRRQKASELAGYTKMPCIVRNMTDDEAILAMTDDNLRQRSNILPMEKAFSLKMQVEAIKHQGGRRLDKVAVGDVGKRSIEIVGERNGLNYKQVQRYIRLTELVPDLQKMVDEKKLSFTPAVEISFIKPANQRHIAVSIEGEQASPSLSQAQELRKKDQEGKLAPDVIDGILSKEKKEVGQVIISASELAQYFGGEKTPREMKDKILELLGEWKEKQPPELGKGEKKVEPEK